MHKEKIKLLEKRIDVFYQWLKQQIIVKTIPLKVEFYRTELPCTFDDRLNGEYVSINEGEQWGKEWESAWFHLTAEVPEEWKNQNVVARMDFGGEALVFDDLGCPVYGLTNGSVFDLDFNKDIYRLFTSCNGGEKVDLYVEAAANLLFGINRHGDPKSDDPKIHGHFDAKLNHAKLCIFDAEMWHLWLDLEVLISLMHVLPENSVRRAKILRGINNAIEAFGNSRENLAKTVKEMKKLYETPANASDMNVIAVGHAHIDTGWLWPVRESIRKCARTFASQIDLLEKYPDYVFGASQAQHYLFVKEHYPKLYKKIKKYIKEGRWEIQGGTWVEHDCNVIGGESMIRQFIHGKNFYRDEFGFEVKNLWLPDVFGYSAAMPQILKKCGVDFFLTQKISWSQFNKFPHHTFKWKGIDGTEIVTHFPPEDNYNAMLKPEQLCYGQDNFIEKDVFDEYMSLFGIGDGGGGPKEEFVERGLREKNLEGCPKVQFGRSDNFFERVLAKNKELETWEGELYLELHRGTYTTQARTKRWNRMLESKLRQVEFICSNLPAEQYPREELDKIWKNLLMNQFHDIIPGSSIHSVYEVAEAEYSNNFAICNELENKAADKLFEKEENTLTIFNSLSYDYTHSIELPESWNGCGIEDEYANPIPVQQESTGNIAMTTIPAHSAITIRKSGITQPNIPGNDLILENDLIKYEFSENGEIISVEDKETGHKVLEEGKLGNKFSLYVDRPHTYDAWDIDIYYENQLIENAKGVKSANIVDGDIRKGLQFELTIGNSNIFQKIYLDANSKRLDFKTEVEWNEMHHMLRVAFPTKIKNSEFISDIQYGYVKRATYRNTSWDMAKFETVAHRYVDLSDQHYGVALLNDCKYGHKVYKNVIDLNLLRSPTEPDPIADQGHHEFTYSLLPHIGTLIDSDVIKEAAMLNTRPVIFENLATDSTILSPIILDADGISLEVVKRAEKDDSIILRLVETKGGYSGGTMEVINKKAKLTETDMLEWNDSEIIDSEQPVNLKFQPFEIRTYRIKL